MARSYKVGVKTSGDRDWASNAQRFPSEADAKAAGSDLFSRWMAVREWKVLPSDEPPNYRWVEGKGAQPLSQTNDITPGFGD